MALAIMCYWPGLYGGFVFDDDVNILQNISLQVKNGSLLEFWGASVSGHAGPLGRPVALLTFAINYYYSGGFDPFQFKLVNLVIHLINSVLIGMFVQCIFRVLAEDKNPGKPKNIAWAGWIVALLWVLHPLNLTAVLYVVQRMTSLCTLFGMAGMIVYATYRSETCQSLRLKKPLLTGIVCMASVGILLFLSCLSKETGILFFPLLLWTEWKIFRFRWKNRELKVGKFSLKTLILCGVGFLTFYICIFEIPSMIGRSAYANRNFTLWERVLTEPRVLVFYLRMLLIPENSRLSLYHDDFEVSSSLTSPASTLFSIIFLLLITAIAFGLRHKRGILFFGWGWFLIAHSLESSIFPLELVYEHRNYFAMIGPLMTVPMVLAQLEFNNYRKWLIGGGVAYVVMLALITNLRAMQWSNVVDWAAMEAANKPNSMRANYEMARVYIILLNTMGQSRFGEMAEAALDQAHRSDPSSLLPLAAKVQLDYMRGLEPKLEDISAVRDGFSILKYRNVNTAILSSLVNCQLKKVCRLKDEEMVGILQAAFDNSYTPSRERAEVLKIMAQYKINQMDDLRGGTHLIKRAIDIERKNPASYIMYAQALAMGGHASSALESLDKAEENDRKYEYTAMILKERRNIERSLQP